MTRLELLERVNELNIRAADYKVPARYWTVTVLYNTVIFKQEYGKDAEYLEVIKGVPE